MFRLSIVVTSLVLLGLAGCRSGGSEADLTASARSYIEKKDHRAAIIQLKNVLNQNPDSTEARVLLGQALLLDNEPAAAAVELRKALEMKVPEEQVVPHLARAMLAMGEDLKVTEQFGKTKLADPAATADLLTTVATAYALRNDAAKATEATAAALQAKPGHVPAIVMMAQLQASNGKIADAITELDKALLSEPSNERAGVLRADLLWRGLKDKAGAMAGYRKVLETTPASLGAHTALIAMLAADGKMEESKAQFDKLKAVLPTHPETLYYEAQIAFSNKEYKRSREITDELLKLMPNNTRVLELAGAAEYRLEQFLPAEAFLSRAIKSNPNALLSRQMLAQVHLRNGQPAKAIDLLQPIVTSKQPDGTSLALAGEAQLQMGNAKAADELFRAAASVDPNNTRLRTAVAISQLGRGAPQAMAELESLAAGDTSARADQALVSALHRKGDLAGALKAIDALEKKQPERALAHGLRGHVKLTQRDNAGARKSFEIAVGKEPGYFPAVAALATLDVAEGKTEVARQRLEAFQKANPKSFQAALGLVELAARTGAPVAEVTRLTQEAVKNNPDNAAARLVLVEQLTNTGDPKAAVIAAQEALAVLPQSMEISEALGRAQVASGDGQQALTTFKKLAAVQPNNPRILVRQAEAQLLIKDVPGATASVKKALEIKPDYAPAKRALVLMAMMDKRPGDAVTLARELQKQTPADGLGWQLEGDAEASRKNVDAALAAWRTSLQKTKSTEYAVKLHSGLMSAGKKADAERWATEWEKENPKDAGFRFYLADITMARGDSAAAEALYRQVLELQPSNALAMNNVAWLLLKQGKPGALPLAEKATTLLMDRAPLLDTLAAARAAENQLPKAIEAQKRAVQLAPANPGLRLNLAKFYVKAGEKAFAKSELETLSKLGDKFSGQAEVASLLKAL